jgi:hypothetical protein
MVSARQPRPVADPHLDQPGRSVESGGGEYSRRGTGHNRGDPWTDDVPAIPEARLYLVSC